MKGVVAALGLSILGVASCAALGGPGSRAPGTRVVAIAGFTFAPAELRVAAGDTIVWANDDALRHSTAADSGAWSSPELERGQRFTFVPKRAGRYPYHCGAHPVMRGVVVVQD